MATEQTPEEYREELEQELQRLYDRNSDFPTEYYQRRIIELENRLNHMA